MKTATRWVCDSCGKLIAKAEDGWLEWKTRRATEGSRERTTYGFRIVHHKSASPLSGREGCYYRDDKEQVADMHLHQMNTSDGLIELLGILATDQVDKDEMAEIIKRVFIFEYDLAKDHFEEAIAQGIFEPNTPPRFHHPGQIEAVVDWLRENDQLPEPARPYDRSAD